MPNEAIRLPGGEVSSSVHYQKTIALSKTLNPLACSRKMSKLAKENPAKLPNAELALRGQRTFAQTSIAIWFGLRSVDSEVGQLAQRRHSATDVR